MKQTKGVFVDLGDGVYARKPFAELADGDAVVFGNPNQEQDDAALQAEIDDEIAAAGGFNAWKSTQKQHATA